MNSEFSIVFALTGLVVSFFQLALFVGISASVGRLLGWGGPGAKRSASFKPASAPNPDKQTMIFETTLLVLTAVSSVLAIALSESGAFMTMWPRLESPYLILHMSVFTIALIATIALSLLNISYSFRTAFLWVFFVVTLYRTLVGGDAGRMQKNILPMIAPAGSTDTKVVYEFTSAYGDPPRDVYINDELIGKTPVFIGAGELKERIPKWEKLPEQVSGITRYIRLPNQMIDIRKNMETVEAITNGNGYHLSAKDENEEILNLIPWSGKMYPRGNLDVKVLSYGIRVRSSEVEMKRSRH